MARVAHLWRHPIKGHGAEAIDATELVAGATMPWDRIWAIGTEASRVEPGAQGWAPCVNFSRGAKSPELMAVRARVDEAAGRVTLSHPRLGEITVDPDLPEDVARLVDWAAALVDGGRARPTFVNRAMPRGEAGAGMTDSDFASIAILNAASLRALEAEMGVSLAMERFRGNIWIEGVEPWAEFGWIGAEVVVGGARLRVRERITRCKATSANPETGRIDADTLGALRAGFGHQDFGIYAEVIGGGRVAVGDAVETRA